MSVIVLTSAMLYCYILDPKVKKHSISWENKHIGLEFSGVPFIVAGRKEYACHLGKDRHEAGKKKLAAKRGKESVSLHLIIAESISKDI